jgi:phosphonate metabolism protein PhnN/1,5-bisphosphokinase (PRPP-forming)
MIGMKKGFWVIVCGPSGVGKDSVLRHAGQLLENDPRIVFSRRLVTRATQPDAHDGALSRDELRALLSSNGIAWHWQAHGHDYVIGASYAQRVARGDIVVVNGSREHAAGLRDRPDVRTVLITAPTETVNHRLAARCREDAEGVAQRVQRNAMLEGLNDMHHVIVNNGPLETAGAAMAAYLRELAC